MSEGRLYRAGSVSPPVVLADLKALARVEHSSEDTLMQLMIDAATEYAEDYLGRATIDTSWKYELDMFPFSRVIIVPMPWHTLTEVAYTDVNGSAQTITLADLQYDTKDLRTRITPGPDLDFPATQAQKINAVTCTGTGGYGDEATDVPAKIRLAILILANTYYAHRENFSIGTPIHELPKNSKADALLMQEKANFIS